MLGGGGGAPHWGEWCGALWNALPHVHVHVHVHVGAPQPFMGCTTCAGYRNPPWVHRVVHHHDVGHRLLEG